MDSIRMVQKKVAGQGAAALAGGNLRLRALCACAGCPTYNECMREKEEQLFCLAGKSPACTFEKKGCICPPCPVRNELRLAESYFCIRGSEAGQAGGSETT